MACMQASQFRMRSPTPRGATGRHLERNLNDAHLATPLEDNLFLICGLSANGRRLLNSKRNQRGEKCANQADRA